MPVALDVLYDAIAQNNLVALKSMLPGYSSWRDQSTALNLAVAHRRADAVRLLAPLSDVRQHDGQIIKTAVFMGDAEVVTALLPFFKNHPQPVDEALEKAINERNLPIVQAIWNAAGDRLTEVQTTSLIIASNGTVDGDTTFFGAMAGRAQPEVVKAYFQQALDKLPPHMTEANVGSLLDPLAPWVPVELADHALGQLGRDAMPGWFRHWEDRQLHAVAPADSATPDPRRRL